MATCSRVRGVPLWMAVAVGTAGAVVSFGAVVAAVGAAVLLLGDAFAPAAACLSAAAVLLGGAAAAAAEGLLFFFCLFPVRASPWVLASSSVSSHKFAALLSLGFLCLW